jgi:hypothetical protein
MSMSRIRFEAQRVLLQAEVRDGEALAARG